MLSKVLVPCLLQFAAVLSIAPVSPDSLKHESGYLEGKVDAEKANVNNSIVKAVLGNGFQYFEQDAATATYKYTADKSEALIPYIQQVIGATDAVADDVAASIIGAEYVTDGGGVQWNHHTLVYTATEAGSKGSSCNYATFIVRIPKEDKNERQLFLFYQKTTFSLAPDVIFLRQCTTSAGFLGIGKHTHCKNVPKNIPHSLDEASLSVLQDYLTSVALLSLSSSIPAPDNAVALPLLNGPRVESLPPAFEATLKALEERVKEDIKKVDGVNKSSSTSKVVKEIMSGGFDKFSSDETKQEFNSITPQGAPYVVKMLASTASAGQPPEVAAEIQATFRGILNASKPLVFSSLGCDKSDTCNYFFVMGLTHNDTSYTDLVTIKLSVPFHFAPDLVVVRQTNTTHSRFGNSTSITDKIKKVPHNVTQQDIDGILAYFEVTVVNKLKESAISVEECFAKHEGLPCATIWLSKTRKSTPIVV
jgi:hypothetical protein